MTIMERRTGRSLFDSLNNNNLHQIVDVCLVCWLKLVDVVALDSAFCNKEERKMFKSYLDNSIVEHTPLNLYFDDCRKKLFNNSFKSFTLNSFSIQNGGWLQWLLSNNISPGRLLLISWELAPVLNLLTGLDLNNVNVLDLVEEVVEDDNDVNNQGLTFLQQNNINLINACVTVKSVNMIESTILNNEMTLLWSNFNIIESLSFCWSDRFNAALVIDRLLTNCEDLLTLVCKYNGCYMQIPPLIISSNFNVTSRLISLILDEVAVTEAIFQQLALSCKSLENVELSGSLIEKFNFSILALLLNSCVGLHNVEVTTRNNFTFHFWKKQLDGVVDCGVSIECDIVNDATLEEIKSFFINNLIKLKHVELNNIGEVDSKLISDIGSRNNILSCLLLSDCSYSITGFNIESIRNLYMNQCKQLKRLLVHEGWEEIGDRIVPTKLPPEILYSVQSNGMLLRSTIDGGKEEGGREILVGLQDELLEICPVWKALI